MILLKSLPIMQDVIAGILAYKIIIKPEIEFDMLFNLEFFDEEI